MSAYPALLRRVLAGEHVDRATAADAVGAIMDGAFSQVQSAALLAALAAKGETVDEVVGAARAMRERSVVVEHTCADAIDVCGTGGDGAGTINISTIVALVVAGAGVPVAKHGNRSASSLCGSADVLEILGVPLDRSPEDSAVLLERDRIAFLFAPNYHPAMKNVGPVRRELGVRTVFNILGPLTNPARVASQVVGVAHERAVMLVGEALRELGSRSVAVVHSRSGLDELAGDAPSVVYSFDGEASRTWTLDPADYGIHATLDDLAGGNAHTNAAALVAILTGERSPRADVVALNAALALVVARRAESIDDGLHLARASIAEGAAHAALLALRGEPQRTYVHHV